VTYFRRPASDRGVSSLYRIEANGFWLVINLLLGGITLFLIGLGLPGTFRKVQANYGWELVLYGIVILLVVQLIRFGVAYFTFQIVSKPSKQGQSPKSWAEATVVAWSGARSFFAVLMVLVLPQTTPSGQPFVLRDLFVVLVCLTTLTSLTVQGLTLPWLVRRLGLAGNPDVARQEQLVRSELAQVALQKLEEYIQNSQEERWLVTNLMRQYQGWQGVKAFSMLEVELSPVATLTPSHDQNLIKLRQSLVAAKALALHSLRERNLIADEVLARYQLELDLEAEWLKSSQYTA
jgi:CPA1 family monovalent cation:H+ antiporter